LKDRSSADQASVFVTGNANKLKEVKAILAAGDSGIEVTSKAVDGESAIAELKLTPSPRSTGYNARSSYRKMPSCRRCSRHGVRD
jgi:inosine/xanthosine triphosphate pyrophosphatase family protein